MITKQIVRARNFVEELVREYPLYSKLPLTQPISSNELQPEVLLLRCQVCRSDRPFHPIRDPNAVKRIVPFEGWGGFDVPPPDLSFKLLLYSCTTCHSLFQCFIEINRKNDYLRKLGQNPPYSIAEFVFDEKIKLVSRVVPNSLPEAVSNPITLTYSRLSDGIHNRTDEECVEIAKRAKSVLVRLLSDLKREQQLKKAYVNDIKALSKP